MIKERILQCKMSEIGRIKIGGLEEQVRKTSTGREWQAPVKFEHFVVTTMERDKSGNFVKDEAIHSVIGDSPRELGIRLLYNDIELNFRTELAYYQGKTCLCRGDGEIAQRLDKETGELTEVACPCNKLNEKMGCKAHGILSCLLEQCTLCGGVHRFATTSWNTIRGIISSLKFISACTGGKIAGLPLKLKYTKKATITKDGQSTTIPVIMIVYDGNPVQMLEAAIQNEKQRIEAGIRMETLETTVRQEMKQLTTNTELLDEEEVEEFHPLEEIKEKVKTIDDALKERTIIAVETPKPVDKPMENVDETPKSVGKTAENVKTGPKTVKEQQPKALAWFWCENLKCVDPISIDKNKTLNTEMCPTCHQHSLHEAKENSCAGAANERLIFLQNKEKPQQVVEQKAEKTEPDKQIEEAEIVPEMSRNDILRGIMRNRNGKKIMTDKFLSLIKPLGVLSARASDWSDEIARKILEITNNYQEA